jgi:CheY-like chemotaxis protein
MRNKKILICDDDKDILAVLSMILTAAGFEVITENNSLNVFSLAKNEQPGLLLLDLWMPSLNGDQVLKTLKQDPETSHLPVMFISASTEVETIAVQSGANGYISKPFEIKDLISKIENTLATA